MAGFGVTIEVDSAKSVASWRTRGGTAGGTEVTMSLAYGLYSRKKNLKNKRHHKSSILVTYALFNWAA